MNWITSVPCFILLSRFFASDLGSYRAIIFWHLSHWKGECLGRRPSQRGHGAAGPGMRNSAVLQMRWNSERMNWSVHHFKIHKRNKVPQRKLMILMFLWLKRTSCFVSPRHLEAVGVFGFLCLFQSWKWGQALNRLDGIWVWQIDKLQKYSKPLVFFFGFSSCRYSKIQKSW